MLYGSEEHRRRLAEVVCGSEDPSQRWAAIECLRGAAFSDPDDARTWGFPEPVWAPAQERVGAWERAGLVCWD